MVTKGKVLTAGALGVVVAVLAALLFAHLSNSGYAVTIIARDADQLEAGAPVWINGFNSGTVEKVEPRDGRAAITFSLDKAYAPLHAGTTARIQWQSVLGERYLTLYPGPTQNPAIPDGAIFQADVVQVEVGQVLNALDPSTRAKLANLVTDLKNTTGGHEKDIQATLQSAGPSINALGDILKALGKDGPAIHDLVVQMRGLMSAAASQQRQLAGSINHLTAFTAPVGAQQRQLSEMLHELPPTLQTAKDTLDRIPQATDPTVDLLHDLRPATARLTTTARNLNPVLRNLRPALGDLRPTLASARELFGRTPGLMDIAHPVLPQVGDTLKIYQPAVSFLRPYTPETIGWIANWGQNLANYDSQGHILGAILGQAGPQAFGESLATPPGTTTPNQPAPGSIVGQTWNDPDSSDDAAGSPVK